MLTHLSSVPAVRRALVVLLAGLLAAAGRPCPGATDARLQSARAAADDRHAAGRQDRHHVEVTFTGTDLEEPEQLLFSHPGIKAEPLADPEPPAKPDPKKPKQKPKTRHGQAGRQPLQGDDRRQRAARHP